jgi:hypothetical protein
MSNSTRRLREPREVLALAIPVLVYLAIAVPVAYRDLAAINPDGIIYIRKAQFLLAGHFWQSVSGYWPPAISWCVALILRVSHKINPLHAIHAVLVFWGTTWLLASCLCLRSLLPGRPTWRLIAGIALAFAGVRQAVSLITPDLLLGTMLMAYLVLVSRSGLLKTPMLAFTAGLCAGFGCLCKSYALPFFCLHFPLTIACRYWNAWRGTAWSGSEDRPGVTVRSVSTVLVAGFVGFAIFAMPWVAVLSHKYGHFTINMVYHHNHMNVAEKSLQETMPDFCVVPPDPYLSIWEGLDPGPRSDWSPFSSWHNFESQWDIVLEHTGLIVANVAKFDYLGLMLLAAVATLIPFRYFSGRSIFSPIPLWIFLTAVIYCLGFLVVAFEVRYIIPILMPLGIALCLREWDELSTNRPQLVRSRWFTAAPLVMTGLFALSAFLAMGQFVFESPARPMFARVATTLKKKHLDGLFTSSDNNKGVNVAYYLNRKIVLMPYGLDFDKIERELSAAGVTEVLVWSDVRTDDSQSYPRVLATMLRLSGRWSLALKAKLDSVRRLDVYVHQTSGASTEPTTEEAD